METAASKKNNSGAEDVPGRKTWLWAGALLALLLGSFAWFVVRSHYIKPYSDPLNWLVYARDFGTEIRTTKWPLGYALFLRGALALTGPYLVFLSNLPVLMGLALLVFALARRCAAATESRGESLFIGVSAAAVLLAVQPFLLLTMANPYRDPLAHVVMLGGALLLLRFLDAPARGRPVLALAGLFLGFSYCVREPSVLVLPPLGLLWLFVWWRDRSFPFWKSAWLFGACLLLGAAPFLVQSFVTTHGGLLPAQSVADGQTLPGLYLEDFERTYYTALHKLLYVPRNIPLFALGIGLLMALWRRNRTLLLFAWPAALGYFFFYCFYWAFVARYFFVVYLFAVPAAVFGVHRLVALVAGRFRAGVPAAGVLATLLVAGAAWQFLRPDPDAAGNFRVGDARRFAREFNKVVPAGSLVLTTRHLCETIRCFCPVESYPAGVWMEEGTNDLASLRRGIRQELARRDHVFVGDLSAPGAADHEAVLVGRLFDLRTVATLALDRRHMDGLAGAPSVALREVAPWKGRERTARLPPLPAEEAILCLDLRSFWETEPRRTAAQLRIDGVTVDKHLNDGGNYYFLRRGETNRGPLVSLVSDAALPADLSPVLHPLASTFRISFSSSVEPPNQGLLREGFLCSVGERTLPQLRRSGLVAVPTWPADGGQLFAEFNLHIRPSPEEEQADRDESARQRAAGKTSRHHPPRPPPHDRDVTVAVSIPGVAPVTNTLVRVGRTYPLLIPLPAGPEPGTALARLELVQPRPDDVVELERMILHRVRLSRSVSIDIGADEDAIYLKHGFLAREMDPATRRTRRWTGEKAGLISYVDKVESDLCLRLHVVKTSRPPAAPPAELKATWNGRPLELAPAAGSTDEVDILEARVPREAQTPGMNRIELECKTWVPAEVLKSGDTRVLGVQLDRFEVRPAAP